MIDQLKTDTAAIKESESYRRENLDTTLKDVGEVIEDLRAANTKREAESRIIANQVTDLKTMIPKALEGWKASGDAKLEELGQEVQSLKKLLENRVGRGGAASTPTSTGLLSGIEKSKGGSDTLFNVLNSGATTPYGESAGASPAPERITTMPKRETNPPRGPEKTDRRAIPAWQMAGAPNKTEPSGGPSEKAEASTAEAGA